MLDFTNPAPPPMPPVRLDATDRSAPPPASQRDLHIVPRRLRSTSTLPRANAPDPRRPSQQSNMFSDVFRSEAPPASPASDGAAAAAPLDPRVAASRQRVRDRMQAHNRDHDAAAANLWQTGAIVTDDTAQADPLAATIAGPCHAAQTDDALPLHDHVGLLRRALSAAPAASVFRPAPTRTLRLRAVALALVAVLGAAWQNGLPPLL